LPFTYAFDIAPREDKHGRFTLEYAKNEDEIRKTWDSMLELNEKFAVRFLTHRQLLLYLPTSRLSFATKPEATLPYRNQTAPLFQMQAR
jgi:hypothetical protein